MDTRCIEYRAGMPFYPVTNPVKEADGLLIEDLRLQQLIDYLNEKDMRKMSLDEMKIIQFDILVDVARFCEENSIRYYLTYGTLLGAVRHAAFATASVLQLPRCLV